MVKKRASGLVVRKPSANAALTFEAGPNLNAGDMADDVAFGEQAGSGASQPGRLFLKNLIAGEIVAGHISLDDHKADIREFFGDLFGGCGILAAVGDDQVRVLLGQFSQRGCQQFRFGLDLIDVADLSAKRLLDAKQAVVAGLHKAAVVDIARNEHGDPQRRGGRFNIFSGLLRGC